MNSQQNRPIALVILDGWGTSDTSRENALAQAYTPCLDELRMKYPSTELAASGASIGLPDGAPGNAEIGHMNIGAGRVVRSDAARVNEAIRSGDFFTNETLLAAMQKAAAGRLHLVGLVSDGDVHSSSETLYALLRMAKRSGVGEAFVHAILDGRDVPPRTADIYVEALEVKMADIGLGQIASLCGRFFAMDSEGNWERTARAYTMLALAEGERFQDAGTAIRSSFLRGISDEFISPIVIESAPDVPVGTIRDGDVVVFFNHRADTMKQLVRSVAVPDKGAQGGMVKPVIEAVCLTQYEPSFNLKTAFPPRAVSNSVAAVLGERRVANYRISEADRFPHVTSFFNGSTEQPNSYEMHIPLPAAGAAVRETEPEMMSFKTTDRLLRAIDADPSGVFIANLPATDLIAETGNLERTVEAAQYIDTCVGGIVDKIRAVGGIAIITSTHANCEIDTGDASGIGRANPDERVPFYLIDDVSVPAKLRSDGSLQDVGATLLALAGIEIPDEMTGRDLRLR